MLTGRGEHPAHTHGAGSQRDGIRKGREQMAAQTMGLFLHFVLKLQSLIAAMNLQGEKGNTTACKAPASLP